MACPSADFLRAPPNTIEAEGADIRGFAVSEAGSCSDLGEGSAVSFGSSSSEVSFAESDELNSDDDEL